MYSFARHHALLTFLAIGFGSTVVSGQSPTYEYGTTAELAGVKSVFLDCGPDVTVRSNIIEVINSRVRGLIFASRPEDAAVILAFDGSVDTVQTGVAHRSTSTVTETPYPKWTRKGQQVGTVTTTGHSTAQYSKVARGEGQVFTVTDSGRIRLLMSFSKQTVDGFGRRPSTGFARRFAEAYLEANPDAAVKGGKDGKQAKKKGGKN